MIRIQIFSIYLWIKYQAILIITKLYNKKMKMFILLKEMLKVQILFLWKIKMKKIKKIILIVHKKLVKVVLVIN